MQLALVSVAPFVLLGFAAATSRSSRRGKAGRQAPPAARVSIGGSVAVRAACRVEYDIEAEADFERDPSPVSSSRTGVAVLRIDIDMGGQIRAAELLTSSGFPVLDTTALTLVRTARMDSPKPGRYRATIVFTE